MMITEEKSARESAFELGYSSRRYDRKPVANIVGDIANGNTVLHGDVKDISTGGFRIEGLPLGFDAGRHTLRAVITCRSKHFKLLVTPRWQKETAGAQQEVGFKILDADWDWLEFSEQVIN